MNTEGPTSPEALAVMIRKSLGSPLQSGEMGVLMARTGVGKTACLTHIAIEHLFQGRKVMHACIGELPEKIKIWYEELMNHMAERPGDRERVLELRRSIGTSRFIMSFMRQTFSPQKLDEGLANLEAQVQFRPDLIVVDGIDFERASRDHVEALQRIAEDRRAAIWLSCRTHRHIDRANHNGIPYPCDQIDDLFQAILLLEPEPENIRITVLKHYDRYRPEAAPVSLDPHTFLLKEQKRGRLTA
jgi:hypothetical protein